MCERVMLDVAANRRCMKAAFKVTHIEDDEPPEGWSVLPVNPTLLVVAFPPLRLCRGWRLVGYRHRMSVGGHGLVYGLPEDAPQPPPEACLREEEGFTFPHPEGAETRYMTLIEGDGSPQSYGLASFLARELSELGAYWHSTWWAAYKLLTASPWSPQGKRDLGPGESISQKRHWRWEERVPRTGDWWPRVLLPKAERPTVVFHTFTGFDVERIMRHEDRYTGVGLDFKTTRVDIGTGERGYVY